MHRWFLRAGEIHLWLCLSALTFYDFDIYMAPRFIEESLDVHIETENLLYIHIVLGEGGEFKPSGEIISPMSCWGKRVRTKAAPDSAVTLYSPYLQWLQLGKKNDLYYDHALDGSVPFVSVDSLTKCQGRGVAYQITPFFHLLRLQSRENVFTLNPITTCHFLGLKISTMILV